jgi:hypothetical protein
MMQGTQPQNNEANEYFIVIHKYSNNMKSTAELA